MLSKIQRYFARALACGLAVYKDFELKAGGVSKRRAAYYSDSEELRGGRLVLGRGGGTTNTALTRMKLAG
jgi:hypothetical protein